MMKDVAVGRYVQGNSVLHRLDPRLKVVLFIVYMVTIFLASTPVKMLADLAVNDAAGFAKLVEIAKK